jgi:hypothetical protein
VGEAGTLDGAGVARAASHPVAPTAKLPDTITKVVNAKRETGI